MPLTATPERLQPRARHFPSKRLERSEISRNGMIVEVTQHHLFQPAAGLLNRIVDAFAQFPCDTPSSFAIQPLPNRLARPTVNLPLFPDRAADMRESQKIERLRFPRPIPASGLPPQTAQTVSSVFSPGAVPPVVLTAVPATASEIGVRLTAGAETPTQNHLRTER